MCRNPAKARYCWQAQQPTSLVNSKETLSSLTKCSMSGNLITYLNIFPISILNMTQFSDNSEKKNITIFRFCFSRVNILKFAIMLIMIIMHSSPISFHTFYIQLHLHYFFSLIAFSAIQILGMVFHFLHILPPEQ